jgi:hypothetical protein
MVFAESFIAGHRSAVAVSPLERDALRLLAGPELLVSRNLWERYLVAYPTHPLAFLNNLIHGESSPASSGAQDICTVLNTRSGCSIRIVNRPSAVVSPVIPSGEPLGFTG